MSINSFIEELKKIGIVLSQEQLNQLEQYYKMLIEKNEKINLTAITDHDQVYLKHFFDSLTLLKITKLSDNINLCDIGTGAGFPGLVLKIVFPKVNVTLVDSLNKRIIFLNEVIDQLNLEEIKTVHARAEEYALNHREEYDIVTARAVAHLSLLLEYSIPLLKNGGYFIAMKSDVENELNESKIALSLLNSKVIDKVEFILPVENSTRTLLKIEKIGKTPMKYPRKYSEIKKDRL